MLVSVGASVGSCTDAMEWFEGGGEFPKLVLLFQFGDNNGSDGRLSCIGERLGASVLTLAIGWASDVSV